MSTETPGPPPAGAPFNPSFLGEIPQLLRGLIDKFLELGQARMELASAEIRAEVEQRIKRLILVIVPLCFILTALTLVNLGLVAWLAESMGPVAASFLLAGIYAVIGVVWLLLWQASGGLNPKKDEAPKSDAPDRSRS